MRLSRRVGRLLWGLIFVIPLATYAITALLFPRGGVVPLALIVLSLWTLNGLGFAIARRME